MVYYSFSQRTQAPGIQLKAKSYFPPSGSGNFLMKFHNLVIKIQHPNDQKYAQALDAGTATRLNGSCQLFRLTLPNLIAPRVASNFLLKILA